MAATVRARHQAGRTGLRAQPAPAHDAREGCAAAPRPAGPRLLLPRQRRRAPGGTRPAQPRTCSGAACACSPRQRRPAPRAHRCRPGGACARPRRARRHQRGRPRQLRAGAARGPLYQLAHRRAQRRAHRQAHGLPRLRLSAAVVRASGVDADPRHDGTAAARAVRAARQCARCAVAARVHRSVTSGICRPRALHRRPGICQRPRRPLDEPARRRLFAPARRTHRSAQHAQRRAGSACRRSGGLRPDAGTSRAWHQPHQRGRRRGPRGGHDHHHRSRIRRADHGRRWHPPARRLLAEQPDDRLRARAG